MSVLPKGLTSSRTGTFYFAFGSNLSDEQMRFRCRDVSSSVPVAVARLDGYKWVICERGYANVVELPKGTTLSDESTVWGLVYNLTPYDEVGLDYYEGHNEERNPKPRPNPDLLTRKKIPYLQGHPEGDYGWDYNKHYLPVTVTKWIDASPAQYGVAGRVNEEVTVLVYVDELRTGEGVIEEKYIGRMNRAIDQSAANGVPREWMDKIMRKQNWVAQDIYAEKGYVGDKRGYVEPTELEKATDAD